MTDFASLRSLLKRFGIWAQKKLGQHFLVDRQVLGEIVAAAEIAPGEEILEIGPGPGVLTHELLKNGAKVSAIEIDEKILPVLKFTTKGFARNLQIFHTHVLHFPIAILKSDFKIVANIPYHLTSPILRKFLAESERLPVKIVLLVQKEIALKICGKKNSILKMQVTPFGKPEMIATVGAASFFPPPKVESAILKIDIFPESKIKIYRRLFFKIFKIGFTHSRKMLKNNLAATFKKSSRQIESILEKCSIAKNARAENLGVEHWESLAQEFFAN